MATDHYRLQQITDAKVTSAKTLLNAEALERRCKRLLVAAGATFSPIDENEISMAIISGEATLAALCQTLGKLRAMKQGDPVAPRDGVE